MGIKTRVRSYLALLSAVLLLTVSMSCENNTGRSGQNQAAKPAISVIKDQNQFRQIMETSGSRLLMIEFYADWCPPCKELDPILQEIAKENHESVTVYKVNTDKNKDLASSFRVTGIPHVAFIKNQETLLSFSGLYPKPMYVKAISRLSSGYDNRRSTPRDGS